MRCIVDLCLARNALWAEVNLLLYQSLQASDVQSLSHVLSRRVFTFVFLSFSLESGAFHDLFWRIKKALPGNVAVSCPDIMFNIHTNPLPDSYYAQLASKWEIKKWVEASGQVRWYGCRRGYQHNIGTQSCSMSKGVANPPCDLENFADAIKFLMKECEDAGLYCELQEGTLLGKTYCFLRFS